MKLDKAIIEDVPQIHWLVNNSANKGEMLSRALSDIYESMRDFYVVREDDKVIACAALHIFWSDLAEIRAIAVAEEYKKQGIGACLVQACLEEAEELGIPEVFCLTYQPAFFEKCGFRQCEKTELPRKVWIECYRCPKFPDCDEIALIYCFDKR